MYFLEHGLGKKLYKIISEYGIGGFRRYENKLFIVMKSSETKDFLFYENTDYFANHIGRVCKAVKCLYSLLRWSDVSDDDSSDSLSAVDERCKEYENGKGRIYSAEQKPVDIDSRIFGTCMSIF